MAEIAHRTKQDINRPLKALVPLIQAELEAGERAGVDHYRRAGELLLEARRQVVYGSWGGWLRKNFTKDGRPLSDMTASRYMRLAKLAKDDPNKFNAGVKSDYTAIVGDRAPRMQTSASFRAVINAARDLDRDLFAQERQTRDDETTLHRDLATELIEIGYRALATRLHPDRGGSKEAMQRLNLIREQLTHIAKTRRFV
jgi:hypothetical protein